MPYIRKKPTTKFDELKEPIKWNPWWETETHILSKNNKEPPKYENLIVQYELRKKIKLLFEYYGIKPSEETYWPPILPPTQKKATHGIAPVDPFFNLVVAMAFDFWPGFQVVDIVKGPGRPKNNGEKSVPIFYLLAAMSRRRDVKPGERPLSEQKVIEREVKDKKSPHFGRKLGGAIRDWKRIKKLVFSADPSSAEELSIKGKRTRKDN